MSVRQGHKVAAVPLPDLSSNFLICKVGIVIISELRIQFKKEHEVISTPLGK